MIVFQSPVTGVAEPPSFKQRSNEGMSSSGPEPCSRTGVSPVSDFNLRLKANFSGPGQDPPKGDPKPLSVGQARCLSYAAKSSSPECFQLNRSGGREDAGEGELPHRRRQSALIYRNGGHEPPLIKISPQKCAMRYGPFGIRVNSRNSRKKLCVSASLWQKSVFIGVHPWLKSPFLLNEPTVHLTSVKVNLSKLNKIKVN
jgi:hypothetical protein